MNLLSTLTIATSLLLAGSIASAQALIKYNFKKDEITQLCNKAIADTQASIEAIKKTPLKKRSFKNTVGALENVMANFSDLTGPLTFMSYVSTDEGLRDEGATCEENVGKLYVTVFSDKGLYLAIKDAKGKNVAQKRLVSETLRGFEKNGMQLSDEALAKVTAIKKELAGLQSQFSANLNNDQSSVVFTKEQLDGTSPDFLARLKKTDDGRYIVTTKSTDYVHVMENAKNPATRKAMLFVYNNRQGEVNTKLLEKAVLLRQEIAPLLGYKTWADYQIDGRMAQTGEKVLTFLTSLKGKLAERNKADLNKLLTFKKELDPSATTVDTWDINYLAYQLKKRDFTLDDELIREYFPMKNVMKGLFEVYSKLLSVRYEEVVDAPVWGPNVHLYKVIDLKSNKLVSYFYADLVPRPGKYGHAAAFPLISGRKLKSGYSTPVASIVANFTPPSGDKPALLTHDEVETLFHEFGHIMHQTLTKAPFASLSGSAVSQDFVEAPSQMLENWVWDSNILNLISGHYLDETKKLPEELRKKMLASKDFNQGYFYTRQLLLGLFDMSIHTVNGPVDVTKVYDQMYLDILGVAPIEGGHFAAGFGHLMGGYDAGYYGYLWSDVYAADMFTKFEAAGLLSTEMGGHYRKTILELGNMINALDLVKLFLGREPSPEAFYKKLGISGS